MKVPEIAYCAEASACISAKIEKCFWKRGTTGEKVITEPRDLVEVVDFTTLNNCHAYK